MKLATLNQAQVVLLLAKGISPAAMIAEAIAVALGGHKTGNGWIAPCPAHDYHAIDALLSTYNNAGKCAPAPIGRLHAQARGPP